MAAHAATATDHAQALALILLALIALTLGYLGTCWLWPFGNCRRCHGTGKRRAPFGRAFRLCRRCDGTGRRLRIGRHVLNYLRSTHDRSK